MAEIREGSSIIILLKYDTVILSLVKKKALEKQTDLGGSRGQRVDRTFGQTLALVVAVLRVI
jgi:hypothetical protein